MVAFLRYHEAAVLGRLEVFVLSVLKSKTMLFIFDNF